MKKLKYVGVTLLVVMLTWGCSKTVVEETVESNDLSELIDDFTFSSSNTNPFIIGEKRDKPRGIKDCCSSSDIRIESQEANEACCNYRIIITNSDPNCNLYLEGQNGKLLQTIFPLTSGVFNTSVCQTTHFLLKNEDEVCETISLEGDCNILGDECCDVQVVSGGVPINGCCWVEAFVYNYGACPLYLFTTNGDSFPLGSEFYNYLSFTWCENEEFFIGESIDEALACTSFNLDSCYPDR